MKKYFNDQASCAHAWAHEHYNEGYASNFFFDEGVIYSYGRHFPIAFLDENTVYFTLNKRSVSTTQHKNLVLSAISHKEVVYVGVVPKSKDQLESIYWQKSNIDYWANKIWNVLKKLEQHPRSKNALRELQTYKEDVLNFLKYTNAKIDASTQDLLDNPSFRNLVSFQDGFETKCNEAILKDYKEQIKAWKRGQRNHIIINQIEGRENEAYLRLNKKSNRIETSKGIEIPLAIAKRFWDFIQSQLPKGCAECNYSILDFKVDSISNKEIKVGCHAIAMKEAKNIAKTLNW